MNPSPSSNEEPTLSLRDPDVPAGEVEPRPWTAPSFVERSTCAEIGAYAFQER